MKKQIVGMVLAGGRVDELSVLTAKRPKSALPVWGMYRIIDFALSNMMHAGIDVVGVLSQYRPYSLITHLKGGEPWDFVGRARTLRVLSPFLGAHDSDWYKGTADSLYQNMGFFLRFDPELVLVASGDHIYSMDYRPMIRQHLATGAELTIALKKVPLERAHQYGTAALDPSGQVLDYREKSMQPAGDLASLTIYVFNTRTLVDRLLENAAEGMSHQLYSEIIPRMVKEGSKVFGHVFDGYWQYARTIDSYYDANMDVVGRDPPDVDRWQVRTNSEPDGMGDLPPVLFGAGAVSQSSYVCPSAKVFGVVERSVLSPEVTVERGAVVRDSVIMHGCRVCDGAVVDRVIMDKYVTVGAGAVVGCGEKVPNLVYPTTLSSGVTVVGRAVSLPPGISVGRGCIIHPDLNESNFAGTVVSGTTVTS
ncbi:MAG: sugar phosphate nucleotidyltransferase [Myxococcota bacterium]|jgi:glucose-1-phosphate adenylyltransferase